MTDILPYRPGGLSRAEKRETRQQLARLDAEARVERARIERIADLQITAVREVSFVADEALRATAMLSAKAQQLGFAVPSAAGRLEGTVNLAVLGLCGVVEDTVRRINRGS